MSLRNFDDDEPVLPYGGRNQPRNSGWSGSETSEDRALEADADGTTSANQREVLSRLHRAGQDGLTVKDLREAMSEHHGVVSGALSVLHKEGRIVRLSATRDRCKIYVSRGLEGDRATEAPPSRQPRLPQSEVDDLVAAAYQEGFDAGLRAQRQREHAEAIRHGEPAATFGAAVSADLHSRGALSYAREEMRA